MLYNSYTLLFNIYKNITTHTCNLLSSLSFYNGCDMGGYRMISSETFLYFRIPRRLVFPWLKTITRKVHYDKFGTGATSSEAGEDGCSADEGDPSAALSGNSHICSRCVLRWGPCANNPCQRDPTGNQCQPLKVNVVLEKCLSPDTWRSVAETSGVEWTVGRVRKLCLRYRVLCELDMSGSTNLYIFFVKINCKCMKFDCLINSKIK